MTKQIPVTHREWALFGLRWIVPLGLLLSLLNPDVVATEVLMPVLGISVVAIVSNLVVLLLLFNDRWSRLMTIFVVIADGLLSLAAIIFVGVSLVWTGLVPAAVAGFYFDWSPGLIMGSILAVGLVVAQVIQVETGRLNLPVFILGLAALPAAGPLAALLSRDEARIAALLDRGKRAEQVSKLATEYIHVVYEMVDVLSVSKLDPKRVLSAAVEFGLEGLERVGIQGPLYGAILLFAEGGEGLETVLRVARVSNTVSLGDKDVVVPGISGVISETLNSTAPAISRAPGSDAELRRFESFGACRSVLCLPLRSGRESYGVMLIGSHEEDAFKEIHVELMQAVANQAAASLHNARLYVSLLGQRDRLVQVEKDARAKLASELHDGPTQGVAAITMRLNYIRKLLEKKPERVIEEIYKIEDMARHTTKEIRHMLFELRPKALDQGLEAGLQQLADKMQETYNQNVEIVVKDRCDQFLDSQTTQTLFSVVAETVNNARKHASAEHIMVHLGIRGDALVLEITDDGVGFDVDEALANARKREGHLGLINLVERATLVEGVLQIESEIGKGTRTTVHIPMEVVHHRKSEEDRRLLQIDEPDEVTTAAVSR